MMIANIENYKYYESLFSLIEQANRRILIVAPYIKSTELRKLVPLIPSSVDEFVCVTRWNPTDVASGACDLEIFDDISKIRGGQLLINPLLHAKYYSNDESALVGSANLTARGLGLAAISNFELLVNLPLDFEGLKEWESLLLKSTFPATREYQEKIYTESLSKLKNSELTIVHEVGSEEINKTRNWIPKCIVPSRLWDVYSGQGHDNMVTSSYNAANEDLQFLQIPKGLDRKQFDSFVRVILSQLPIFINIDELSNSGLTDELAREMMYEYIDKFSFNSSPDEAWEILKQWMLHFFADTYRTREVKHVFIKGKEF